SKRVMEIEGGNAFWEFHDIQDAEGNRINPKLALWASAPVGVMNGLLEIAQIGTLMKSVPGLRKIVSKGANKTVIKALKSGAIKRTLLRNFAKFGADLTSEVSIEVLQETVNMLWGEFAIAVSNEVEGTDFAHQWDQMLPRAKEIFVKASLGFTGLLAPGRVVITGMEKGSDIVIKRRQAKIEKEAETEARYQRRVENALKEGTIPVSGFGMGLATTEDIVSSLQRHASEQSTIQTAEQERAVSPELDYIKKRRQLEEDLKDIKKQTADEIGSQSVEKIEKVSKEEKKEIQQLAKVLRDRAVDDYETSKEAHIVNKIQKEGKINLKDAREKERVENIPPKVKEQITTEKGGRSLTDTAKSLDMTEDDLISVLENTDIPRKPSNRIKDYVLDAERELEAASMDEGPLAEKIEINEADMKKGQQFTIDGVVYTVTHKADKKAILENGEKIELGELDSVEVDKITLESELRKKYIESERAVEIAQMQVERAGKLGRKVGEKIGVSKERQAIRTRKARKMIKDYKLELGQRITRDIPKSVAFEEAEAIRRLTVGIDPSFCSDKTKAQRQNAREYFNKHPEIKAMVGKNVLDDIYKKPLNEWTVKELEALDNAVQSLVEQGKTKLKLRNNRYNRSLNQINQDIQNSLLSMGEKTRKARGVGHLARAGRLSTFSPSRLFMMGDGNTRGPIYNLFWRKVNTALDNELTFKQERKDAAIKQMKENNLTPNKLLRKHRIEGKSYTVDSLMHIYMGWKNIPNRLALQYGNNITEKIHDKAVNLLTENQKKMAEWLVNEMSLEAYPRLRKAYIWYKNEDLGYHRYYIPMLRKDWHVETEDFAELLNLEKTFRQDLQRVFVEQQFAKARENIPPHLQKEIDTGLFALWNKSVDRQEHFITHAKPVKMMNALLSKPDFKKTVNDTLGPEYYEELNKYVQRVANPVFHRTGHWFEQVLRHARLGTYKAYLAFNVVTMSIQFPSILLSAHKVGPGYLLAASARFAIPGMGIKMIKEANEKIPQIKHRAIEREMEEMKLKRMNKRIGDYGMEGIKIIDKMAVTIVGHAALDRARAMNMSEEEAVNFAEETISETQPAFYMKDLPSIYATNEYMKVFLQFTNQLNKIYQISTKDIPVALKQHKFWTAFVATAGVAMNSLIIYSISHRRLPTDWWDVAKALWENQGNALPIIGRMMVSYLEGFKETSPPAYKIFLLLPTIMKIISKGMSGEELTEYEWKQFLEALAVASHLPYTQSERLYQYLVTGEAKELIGGQPYE
ncbi:MAG: hypothetical protein ACOC80_10415, partial [Petrotogales bacterium]